MPTSEGCQYFFFDFLYPPPGEGVGVSNSIRFCRTIAILVSLQLQKITCCNVPDICVKYDQ